MRKQNFLRSHRMLLLCGFLLLCVPGALAQTGTSSVRGTVLDAKGAAVPGATVTLSNTEKSFTRTQTTTESGNFTFAAVPPGTYRIEAESAGFKKTVVEAVQALVDTPVDIDLNMEVGAVTETVNVTGGTEAPLNTTDASIGVAFEAQRIQQLPLNARNVVSLLSLQPGVTRDGYVNGARSDQANVTLDGVDVNEQQTGLDVQSDQVSGVDEAFASVLRSTPDSLQEFRVTTTNPNADQGRSSGAQVSLVTRSGTNEFHGSLYEYHRNTVTTANDFFNNKAGRFVATDLPVVLGQKQVGEERVPRPKLLRNVFGGSIGGPIKKNRAFFFFTYEGTREASEESVVQEVPLTTLGQGIVRYRSADGSSDPSCPAGTPSGVICLTRSQISAAYLAGNGIDPGTNSAALAVLADAARRYTANDTTVGDGLNTSGFRFNASRPAQLNVYHLKFDFNLTDRQTLFVRGVYQNDNVARVRRLPDTPAPQFWNHPRGLAIGHTWTISNKMVNRFNYGFTRAAFTSGGDSTSNLINFRFIYQPLDFSRTLSRVTPVHNFVDDLSYVRGNHTFGVGANVRLIKNSRLSFGASFDSAITNPSFYDNSGDAVLFTDSGAGDPIFDNVSDDSATDLRDALTAVIGRFSQFDTDINYDKEGNLLPGGTGIQRTFATQEYETYFQDSWRMRPNFTINYGVRWSTSTPVYEVNGVQVTPTTSLSDFFQQRVASANNGVPYNALITVDIAGKANNRPGYYPQDWNNFAPSVSFAWSPNFNGRLGRLLGRDGKSVIRGGYRMTYDRIGSQLAVSFDLNSTLGFHSNNGVAANTFNVSDRLGPLFTGFNVDVRSLLAAQGVTVANKLTFPLTTPADEDQRIERSLDDKLTTPYNHSFNLSYGREIGKGLSFEVSYVGRFARKLLASRDVMHLNNIKDPASGQTWYEGINKLIDARYAGVPITQVQSLPFFEHFLPGLAGTFNVLGVPTVLTATQRAYMRIALPAVGGLNSTDYTFKQSQWDDTPIALFDNLFFHPQYAALSVFSTIAKSNYNSAQFSLRQRLRNDISFDFNYTYGHSLDNASGLQNSTLYGSAFIVNPLDPDASYASSDFDVRHIINANWLIGLPVGRGKYFLGNTKGITNTILGGWQLTGVFRWNSGAPIDGQTSAFFEADRWATNWNVQSNMVRIRRILSSPSANVNGEPNLFSDPTFAFQSFRDPRAGEPGDRNVFRAPGYFALDSGLYKTFNLSERQRIQFRWEVYNVTNTQRFSGANISGNGISQDPFIFGTRPPSDFGKFTETQKSLNENRSAGRVMQFALRYEF